MLASRSLIDLSTPVEAFFANLDLDHKSGFAESEQSNSVTSNGGHNLIAGIASMGTSTHLRYANLHRAIQLEVLERIISQDEKLMTLIRGIKELGLPDGWLVSGALYQSVWNVLTDKPRGYGIKDYDVVYFDDSDTSYEAEDAIIRKVDRHFGDFEGDIEVRNQARVHLWYPERFGGTYPKLDHAIQSLNRYTTIAHMVGVRLDDNGYLEIAAPKGLNDIFSFILRPNKALETNGPNHARKSQSIVDRWPEVSVVPWD